mgnify:CR=1 FL=1
MTEPSYHYTLDRDGRMAPAYTLSDLEATLDGAVLFDAALDRLRSAREGLKRAGWPAEPTPHYTYLDPAQASAPVIRGYCPPVTVTFTRRIHGRRYSYAAVGVGGRWYLTGNKEHNGESKTWTELLEYAGDYGRATLCVSQAAKYIGVGQ